MLLVPDLRPCWASWADCSAIRNPLEPIERPLGAILARLGALWCLNKSRDRTRRAPQEARSTPWESCDLEARAPKETLRMQDGLQEIEQEI
eukprot:6606465-Pyramimonas_sp.AAC.1